MGTIPNDKPIERFKSYLADEGLKFTKQRRAIAEAFYASGDHLSLNDVLELARVRHASVGYATVYRTMKLLADSGLATEHHFLDGNVVYEPSDAEHHDHLVCLSCERIIEFEEPEIERLQDAIAKKYGFTPVDHQHVIYGYCNKPSCKPS